MDNLAAQLNEVAPEILQGALEIRYATRVIEWLHTMIRIGKLRAGDRLPSERELSRLLRIGREGAKTAIDYLAIIGVVRLRQNSGAFIETAPEDLRESLSEMNWPPPGCEVGSLFEARAAIEGNIAALAAERNHAHSLSRLADELMELYATVDDPREYLVHEMAFHRIVAQAAGNPVLSILMLKLAAAFYDACKHRFDRQENMRESANRHRRIFRAIRDRKPSDANEAVADHIDREYAIFKQQIASAPGSMSQ